MNKTIQIEKVENGYVVHRVDDLSVVKIRKCIHSQIEEALATAVNMLGIHGSAKIKVVIKK